ncbi:MAG: zinc ribbon domain-containing protein [Gammaproteobacteria bacterium]|nr:zinc ribbon domain-containing protein [Gammaproteobacteria bacterium]
MKCPKCNYEQNTNPIACPKCGIYFEKYLKYHGQDNTENQPTYSSIVYKQSLPEKIKNYDWSSLLFYVDDNTDSLLLMGRLISFIIIFIWGWFFIFSSIESNYVGESFMHLINLPFHEAGHVIFSPFGSFITSLGGTLGQMLIPIMCLWTFLFKYRNTFGAAICLWWLGQNFLDIAPYINDARAGVLPLVGGNTGQTSPYGFHDWEYLLTESGLLHYDHSIARVSFFIGTMIILTAYAWGGFLLFKQVKNVKH